LALSAIAAPLLAESMEDNRLENDSASSRIALAQPRMLSI
jgi:hypothetical protein